MIVTVHGGHGYPGKGATGVAGYINESIQDRIVKDKVIELLRKDGHEATDITVDSGSQNQILSRLVSKANSIRADLNVSIHFNAANGSAYGTETWIKKGDNRAKDAASRIDANIVKLGYRDRGVKTTTDLYILNKMQNPTLLVECCFADNAGDYQKYNADTMARAIAEGIVGHEIKEPEVPKVKHTAELVDLSKYPAGSAILRLYNKNTSDHFFTNNPVESDILIDCGWVLEGISWIQPKGEGHIPVHRLYNPNNGDHHYTIADNECGSLMANGWSYEGICFYSDKDQHVPVYRLYNPNQSGPGSHFYIINDNEKNNLVNAGWFYEGIGWYGAALP